MGAAREGHGRQRRQFPFQDIPGDLNEKPEFDPNGILMVRDVLDGREPDLAVFTQPGAGENPQNQGIIVRRMDGEPQALHISTNFTQGFVDLFLGEGGIVDVGIEKHQAVLTNPSR